jgi:hypothetical protein
VLVMAAYTAQHTGDRDTVDEFCRQATEAERNLPSPRHGRRIEMYVCSLRAQALLAGGNYIDALSGYVRAAELASAAGYLGLGACYLAYGVSCAVLGGVDDDHAVHIAEDAVALARRSGMPSAIVLGLNAFAFALVERDPARSRPLLKESVELASTPGEEVSSGLLTASMVAGASGIGSSHSHLVFRRCTYGVGALPSCKLRLVSLCAPEPSPRIAPR